MAFWEPKRKMFCSYLFCLADERGIAEPYQLENFKNQKRFVFVVKIPHCVPEALPFKGPPAYRSQHFRQGPADSCSHMAFEQTK